MASPIDFANRPLRSRFEAFVLNGAAAGVHQQFGRRKQQALSAMTGTVVEIGPGTGVNMRYYTPGIKLIAVEPNPHLHPALTAAAQRYGIDLEIRSVSGESIDVADDAADGVVGTFVLCGVDDPAAVLGEVRRILADGGTYFFLEHVVAPSGSWTRRIQRLAKRPHRWLFNGCEVDRDLADALRSAGFADIEILDRDAGWRGAYVRHQIVGTAVALAATTPASDPPER